MTSIQNKDNGCFRWCLVRYLNLVNKTPAKIKNVDKEFAKELDFNGVKFPVLKKDYGKMEKQNNISINVFGYEGETPYHIHTSKQTFGKHVNLLLLSNSKNSHYVLIKCFSRFMTSKTKHHDKKIFFGYCLP